MNEAMKTHRQLPSPPPAKSAAARVLSDVTPGNSGVHSTVTLTTSAPSRFDADRMEAALAMTQMSQGNDRQCDAMLAESESDIQQNQRYHRHRDCNRSNKRLNHNSMAAKQNTWQPGMSRRSPDVTGGTEVAVDDSPEVTTLSHDHSSYLAAPRDGRTAVDRKELARMTLEVLERRSGVSHDPTGRFIRTCSQQSITTDIARTQTENRLICEPSLTSGRPNVAQRPVHQQTSEEDKLRPSRSSGIRRASSDEVDERRTTRSWLAQSLARQSSDPSERRRSPQTKTRPAHARDLVDGRLAFPEVPSSSYYLQHPERGPVFVSPVSAVGGSTPCWGVVVPLSAVKLERYGSAIPLCVPRVVALQEEEGIIPESSYSVPTNQNIRQSFAESDVFVASATIPLHAYKCSTGLARDRSADPTENSEKPVNDAQQYIVKALESVKVQDQIRTESDMDASPLDLTRSAPNLAAANAKERNLTTYSKYDRIANAHHGRSSSFGSLSALRALYDDPSMKSWPKKTRSGSENSPLADAGAKSIVGTHSEICEGQTDDVGAAKARDMDSSYNTEVLATAALRSEFRARPYRTIYGTGNASSFLRSSPPLSATPRCIGAAQKPSTADVEKSCNSENETSGSSSPADLQSATNDTSSAGSDLQVSPVGDAAVVDSTAETAPSSPEMEKCFNGRPLVAEECRNRVMDTLDLRESPPILKISVEERSFVASVVENGEERSRSPAFDEEALDTKCVVDGRPASHDHNHISACDSSLPGSSSCRDSLDLSWRLPLKKRRVLDWEVLPPAELSDNRLADSATVKDRVGFSVEETPTAVCLKTQPSYQAECEYTTLSLSTTREAAWYTVSVVSVCLSVYECLSDDNFRKPRCKKFIFAHPVISRKYGLSSYVKVIGSRSRSQEQKVENPYSCNVELRSAITPLL